MGFIIKNITAGELDLGDLSPTYLDPDQQVDLTKYNEFTDIVNSFIFLKDLQAAGDIEISLIQIAEASLFNDELITTVFSFFAGIKSDSTEMQSISSPTELSYIGRLDTDTIWQYQDGVWTDTLMSFDLQGFQAAEDGAQDGNIIIINDDGNTTIENSVHTVSVLLGTGDTGWQMEGASSYNKGGIVLNEKIHNAGEWFEFDNLKFGLNNKYTGFGIVKAGTTETGGDAGTGYGIGGSSSNYEADLFDGSNLNGKGVYSWLGVTASSYWTLSPNTGWGYPGIYHFNSTNTNLWNGGDKFRVGIDDDGIIKYQIFYNGDWETVAQMSGSADVHADGYKFVWRPYQSNAQLNQLPTVHTVSTGSNGGALPTYANTHYISFDGSNDYVGVNGVEDASLANVLKYGEDFLISMDIGDVSSLTDSAHLTLFKHGNCELTLRRAGNTNVAANWGIYAYVNGVSVWQANTWKNPMNSRIIIMGNATHLKYYTSNYSNTLPKVNSAYYNTNNTDTSTENFTIGKSGNVGGSWYGGVDNCMLMVGAGSQLGTDAILELMVSTDPTTLSFYDDVSVMLPMGEDTHPAVADIKGLQDFELFMGTASDFVQK